MRSNRVNTCVEHITTMLATAHVINITSAINKNDVYIIQTSSYILVLLVQFQQVHRYNIITYIREYASYQLMIMSMLIYNSSYNTFIQNHCRLSTLAVVSSMAKQDSLYATNNGSMINYSCTVSQCECIIQTYSQLSSTVGCRNFTGKKIRSGYLSVTGCVLTQAIHPALQNLQYF